MNYNIQITYFKTKYYYECMCYGFNICMKEWSEFSYYMIKNKIII